MAEVRAQVFDLSASYEGMPSRIAALEANVDGLGSDSASICNENQTLRSQITEQANCVSCMECGRASPDITISGLPPIVTDSLRDIFHKVFVALGIPELESDVLDIRILASKTDNVWYHL